MTAAAIFALYFGYPAGAVWSNLIASAICSAVVYLKLHFEHKRNHAEQMAQHDIAQRIAADAYRAQTGEDHPLMVAAT